MPDPEPDQRMGKITGKPNLCIVFLLFFWYNSNANNMESPVNGLRRKKKPHRVGKSPGFPASGNRSGRKHERDFCKNCHNTPM